MHEHKSLVEVEAVAKVKRWGCKNALVDVESSGSGAASDVVWKYGKVDSVEKVDVDVGCEQTVFSVCGGVAGW
eukprot:6491763-Amphidinium_carterae.1